MIVANIVEDNRSSVKAFLERNSETALFLLSNLERYGPKVGDSLDSGNYKLIQYDRKVLGVFSLTRKGTLFIETGGRTDFASVIVRACNAETIAVQGVMGEWESANAVWQVLRRSGVVVERYRSRETLLTLDLRAPRPAEPRVDTIRQLHLDDFTQWLRVHSAYLTEAGYPIQGTVQERRATFEEQVAAGRWWGCFEDGTLVAIAALNALYRELGQVGSVYTAPARRQAGLARSLMHALIDDCVRYHALCKLILFTGQDNRPAQRLYNSLGFVSIGEFGLFFGDHPEAV